MRRRDWSTLLVWFLVIALWLVCSCAAGTPAHGVDDEHADLSPTLSAAELTSGERLQVVATTNIVGDVVGCVGAGAIDLTVLMPLGADPHAFEPTPRDAAAVANAHVVFANGVGLETFMGRLLSSAGQAVPAVAVSHGLDLLLFEGAEHAQEGHEEEEDGEFDPHTWFDPVNVKMWVDNIEGALSILDPSNRQHYVTNAAAYRSELDDLHAWIGEEVTAIPEARRQLVTDHASFSYFSRRYGFEQIGVVFPGYSTLAEPSARELATLEDAIRQYDVPAVFVGLTVNSALAERVSQDTGTRLVRLYTGSLSAAGGPADSYLAMMRYNVRAIVEALR